MTVSATAHFITLRDSIVEGVVRNAPIGTLLQQAKILALLLRDTTAQAWVDAELHGYSERSPSLPEYRSCRCRINAKIVFFNATMTKELDPGLVEQHNGLTPGKLSILEIPFPATTLESQLSKGTLNFTYMGAPLEPLIHGLFPGGRCVSASFSLTTAEIDLVLGAVRSRLLEFVITGQEDPQGIAHAAARSTPSTSPSVNVVTTLTDIGNPTNTQTGISAAMTSKNITISPSGSNLSNVIVDSDVKTSTLMTGAQRATPTLMPTDAAISSDDEKKFREDVREVLHLLVDRYEEIETSVQRGLQDVLTQIQRLDIQGKTLAEVEDMLSDLWATSQVAGMKPQLPAAISDMLGGKKILSLLTKFLADDL